MTVTNNNGKTGYTFTGNGEFTFEFKDAYGNTGSTKASVNWINKDSLTGKVTYSTTGKTNQDVVATISFDKSDVTVTNNGGATSYTFTENGEFTFEFKDAYGNTGTAKASVTWINKESVTGTIQYSTTEKTNKDVIASISFNKTGVTVTNNSGKTGYTFTENGEFTFEFKDAYGNTGSTKASVNWINKDSLTGKVTYSTTGKTNQDVVATIAFDKSDVTVTNNGGATSYTFTGNGEFTFEFKDAYGNTGSMKASVNWINKEAVTGTISYSTTEKTNKDVIASISFNKTGVTVTNNSGKTGYTFTENGDFTFEFKDAYGNTGSTKASVNWINKDSLTGKVTYSTTGKTNQDVVATISFDTSDVTVTNNGGATSYTFTENGDFTFEFKDAYGNTGSTTAKVTWINKEAVTGKVTYSTTGKTNQDVIATIAFDKSDVIVTNNGGATSYTFTENGDFTFEFKDAYGNTGTAKASVTWINKESLTGKVTYSTTGKTNQNVVATIAFDKSDVTITNNGGATSYTFTENGEFTFEFKDAYGNTGNTTAKVTWINKEAVTGTIQYSTTEKTNKDVIATISFNKTGVTITNNSGKTGYTFTENGEFTFEFKDAYGNTGSTKASVTWIDKAPLIATLSYSHSGWTHQNVKATISFNKSGVLVTNNGGNTGYLFTGNGNFTFQFRDTAGNTGEATATVTGIYKDIVLSTLTYSTTGTTTGSVTATLHLLASGLTLLNNQGNPHYTFTGNGSFGFIIQDSSGNLWNMVAEVENILPKVPLPPVFKPSHSSLAGGGSAPLRDVCPGGDASPSYYDGSCGVSEQRPDSSDGSHQQA